MSRLVANTDAPTRPTAPAGRLRHRHDRRAQREGARQRSRPFGRDAWLRLRRGPAPTWVRGVWDGFGAVNPLRRGVLATFDAEYRLGHLGCGVSETEALPSAVESALRTVSENDWSTGVHRDRDGRLAGSNHRRGGVPRSLEPVLVLGPRDPGQISELRGGRQPGS